MRAISWTAYGSPDVLKLHQAEKPMPKSHEVLVKVHASTVTKGDVRLRACDVPAGFWLPTRMALGVLKPRVKTPGMDFSGTVEAIGNQVTSFAVGSEVYGTAGMLMGAHAEYLCLPEKAAFVEKPQTINHEQAAAIVFGGVTALHFLKNKPVIKDGHKVLINGASGAVGTAAIQLAKYLGAEVTGVCSAKNIPLIEMLGVNHAFDYRKKAVTGINQSFDVILDAVGNLTPKECRSLLTTQGKFIAINAGLLMNLSALFRCNLIAGVAKESKEALVCLRELVDSGDIEPIIDEIFFLEEAAKAHQYVDTGRKKGSVVLLINKS